ncbi:hemerythrin domain-containing protein [Jatrophihabitans fulvus]
MRNFDLALAHTHTTACWWHPLEAHWVCPTPATRLPEQPLVDVRDMVVVHTALLREFRLAPAAVRRVPAGDRALAGRVVAHLRFVGDLLHHHHEGEDELLWPLLRERVPAPELALADAEAQHAAIDAALDEVTRRREAWAVHADAATAESLIEALDHLFALVREHLDHEEEQLLPLAAAMLSPAEWAAIGERAAAAIPKPALALAFGMFAYEGDPAVVRQMLGEAPPPVRVLLPRLAPRLYARRARRVYGTPTP